MRPVRLLATAPDSMVSMWSIVVAKESKVISLFQFRLSIFIPLWARSGEVLGIKYSSSTFGTVQLASSHFVFILSHLLAFEDHVTCLLRA